MKKFCCTLEKMAGFGDTLDPDCNVVVWTKYIKATGIMKAIKMLNANHKAMKLLQSIDKLNPNHYRCNVDNGSNYYEDIRGFEFLKPDDLKELRIGHVMVEVFEVREDDRGNEIRNYGYEKNEDWY